MRIVIAAVIALVVFIVLLLAFMKSKGDDRLVKSRMASLTSYAEETVKAASKEEVLRVKFMKFVGFVASKLRSIHTSGYFDLKMQQADWPILGSEFQVILAVLSVVAGVLTLLITWKFSMFIMAVALTPLIGVAYMKLHISRRQAAFMNQLGDTLIMVSNALRAGFSFLQAMEYISHEMQAPIGVEFQKVVNEMNLGSTLETALENMNKRVESKDFDLVVTAVLIQRQVGGNLSQVLDSISNTINERIRMRREVLSLTAQGRLSGLIVGLLPFGMVALAISPTYFDPLTESPTGRLMIGAACFLEFLAAVAIRRIVDIKM